MALQESKHKPRVLVMGGGLAGLSAALHLSLRGCQVTLVEKNSIPGGRTSSWTNDDGNLVDYGLHVFCRHYLNLLNIMRMVGSDKGLVWFHKNLYFRSNVVEVMELNGPVPFHVARYSFDPHYSLAHRLAAVLAGMRLGLKTQGELSGEDFRTYEEWNNSNHLGEKMLRMGNAACEASTFLPARRVSAKPVLSWMKYLLRNSQASDIGMLTASLRKGLIDPILEDAKKLGMNCMPNTEVLRINSSDSSVTGTYVRGPDEHLLTSDYYVSALPVEGLQLVLDKNMREFGYFQDIMKIKTVSATSVTVWFDRRIPGLGRSPMVVEEGIIRDFVDLTQTILRSDEGSVVQFLLGDSSGNFPEDGGDVVPVVLAEFHKLWPGARDAGVRRAVVNKIPHAMYAAYPGVDKFRPAQRTPIKNFFVAGDWTQHELNACMEGAVVSGMLASNEILRLEGLEPTNIQSVDDELLVRGFSGIVRPFRNRS